MHVCIGAATEKIARVHSSLRELSHSEVRYGGMRLADDPKATLKFV
jgi:hypothetical protein